MSKTAVVCIVACVCVSLVVSGYFLTRNSADEEDNEPLIIGSGDLSIHFLELGNKYTGDSVYIKYNSTDIIIDAGSRTASARTIVDYVNRYTEDGIIEYVVATHAHQDHIAGFYSTGTGSNRVTGVLDAFEIGTIIDYPMTNSTTATRANYEAARDRLAGNGTAHYSALQCYNGTDGAQREYILDAGLKLEILYNYYYDHYTSNENNYSVCLRIVQGADQYLFTGDLESDGESRLVDHYAANHGGLGQCVLYKAGHHGSSTSSSNKLLNEIRPQYVMVTTCAGTSEYSDTPSGQFPTQNFINRIAPHTSNVYVTTVIHDYKNNRYGSMNGNIVFLVSGGEKSVVCSNNDTVLKDTEWFRANRTMPAEWT